MELKTRDDIEAPIAFVFAQVTDFLAFERQALRRGASVRRTDDLEQPGPGMAWEAAFKFRGKERKLDAQMAEFDPTDFYIINIASGGVTGKTNVDLVALSRGRTRLTVRTELAANGLTARLLLQSLRLARANLLRRLSIRVTAYARDIEDRFSRQA